MRIHPTDFVLQDGVVRYDDMQIDIGKTPIHFKGVIGLDKRLDMMVALPLGSLAGNLSIGDKSGGAAVWLPLTGTIDNPKLDTSRLLESQLQDTVKGLLQDLLK